MQKLESKWGDRFLLRLVLLGAVFALVMHAGIAATGISRTEWKPPADYIRQHYRPGDVVGLVPPWALKGAEMVRGLPLLYAEDLPREDLSRYRRLWLLVAPRLGKWWFRRSFNKIPRQLHRRYSLRLKRSFPKVDLYLFQLPPPARIFYDFIAKKNLRRAEVGLETPHSYHKKGRCPATPAGYIEWLTRWRENPGWFLGQQGYFFGRIIQEIGNTPRHCLWASPQRCKILRVRYRNVPLRGSLLLEHGFTTPAPRNIAPSIPPRGPDVEIEVRLGNSVTQHFRVSEKQGWRRHWLDIPSDKQARGDVLFRIQVPGRQSSRTGYCFRAELRQN